MIRAGRLGIAAVACALLAAWLTFEYTSHAEQTLGAMRSVVVTDIPRERGTRLDSAEGLAVRRVPSRFAPPDVLADPADAVGERIQTALPGGAFITRSALGADRGKAQRFKLRPGERALTVEVIVSPAGRQLAAGDRVDLYASGFGGGDQTEALLSAAEVIDTEDGSSAGKQQPTLRIGGSQVAAVVRADVFAHELRAVLRP